MAADPITELDMALVRLRRLWSPARRRWRARDGRDVEMSSLLVVEACAQLASRGGEVSVGDIARFTDVEPSTASRLVERAAAAGLVAVRPSADDARRSAIALTAEGASLRREAVAARTAWLREQVATWPADDVETFSRLLARFADEVPGHPGDASR